RIAKRRAPQSVLPLRVRERRTHADVGAARTRVERVADDETRIVEPRVRVDEAFAKARPEARAVVARIETNAERFGQRHPASEPVVQQETGADHPGRPQMRLPGGPHT